MKQNDQSVQETENYLQHYYLKSRASGKRGNLIIFYDLAFVTSIYVIMLWCDIYTVMLIILMMWNIDILHVYKVNTRVFISSAFYINIEES